MKAFPFNRVCRALFLAAALPAFSANAQSVVISNAAPAAIPRRDSIILIVADGLGYGDLSCYGQKMFQTPNIDRLAADGMRFTNYSAGGASEQAASAALMLGKDSGGRLQGIPLSPNDMTVAQVLKNSGYRTCLLGGWNLGDEHSSGAPWKKGFDEFAGYLDPADARNFYADYMFRYAPRSILNETNNQMETFMGRETLVPNLGGAAGQFIPDLLTKAALNFIRISQPDGANRYRPFFLLLHYEIPGDGGSRVPTDAPYSEERWPQPEKNKAAMIARLDGYIGQVEEQLGQLGLTNNTAIFFTSGSISKKGNGIDPEFFHSNASTNDFRVPMIVRWPDGMPAGRASDFKWSAKDFLPTAAEIAITKPPEGIDGVSLLSANSQQATK